MDTHDNASLNASNSMQSDEIHSRVLRELAKVLIKPLSIIYHYSCLTGEVSNAWRLVYEMLIYKKAWKEDLGNHRLVNLPLVPGKVVEHIFTEHMQDNQGIRPGQYGFMKDRYCLTNRVSFYDKVICLVDEGKAVAVVYLDFSKAFDTVPQNILLEKQAYSLLKK
ncbi:RNA-directed DNA polymerase from mobile element jockey-like protein [Willisornis vidua]|uniref:RNA-directed DNA polymerase from mobile element jockey-like protein n=1 Tax=Willisornis vidua TaxID=1566151 RepID=A0ABQ9CZ96_9PASS|nr:RNA-directed DNA polymerase from mobile element jockey-like protein [Willisornis vidua]